MTQRILPVLTVIVALMFAMTGCAGAGSTAAGSAAPASSPAQAATDAPAAPASPAAATTAPADATQGAAAATAAPKDVSSSAFQYYLAVKLGMTKDEADKAIGLEAKAATGEFDPENAFNYIDSEGFGVYVIYNKDLKAFSKVAIYPHEEEAVAPLTKKPVTKDQKGQIAKGTAHADIATLLGGDGVETTLTAMENNPATPVGSIYHWANADGSFIQIAFDAEGKAQNIMFMDSK